MTNHSFSSLNNSIEMTKHEGNGNDFLVLLDIEDRFHFSSNTIRWLCDRRRGIGADGFIRAVGVSGEYDAFMELTNADGTRAEMSGNGIRCLAQAIYDFRHDGHRGGSRSESEHGHEDKAVYGPEASIVRIATDAGVKDVLYQPTIHSTSQSTHDPLNEPIDPPTSRPATQSHSQSGGDAWLGSASVSMGSVTVGDARSMDSLKEIGAITDREPVWVDVGNPHLVLIGDDPVSGELESVAPKIARLVPGGVNVEMCWLDSSRKFAKHAHSYGNGKYDEWYGYAVYERGVGPTLSCGTGAVAVCAALRSRESPPSSSLPSSSSLPPPLSLSSPPSPSSSPPPPPPSSQPSSPPSMLVISEGGPLEVIFDGLDATLRGPVSRVADLYIDLRRLQSNGLQSNSLQSSLESS